MGMKIENDTSFIDSIDAQGDRELKNYKDIYGNDVRLLTSKERSMVNKGLIVASVFIIILCSGLAYQYYMSKKEIEERTKLYMTSGETITDGQEIVSSGGTILSDDSSIVSVESDGTIIANASGTTNLTIFKNIDESDFMESISSSDYSSLYNDYNSLGVEGEITYEVIVQQAVTGVVLNIPTINLDVGSTAKLTANIFPQTSYNKDTTWTSSDTSIATVDSNGVVTARNSGEATITVTTKDGNFTDSTMVKVSKEDSENNIYLGVDSTTLYVGESETLETVVSPDQTLLDDITYSSTDSSILSVDTNGKITAKKVGTATITAKISSENIESSITITVKEKELENIYLSANSLSLTVGDNVTLKSYFYPNESSSYITYTSSDSSVASINSKGEIIALKEGTTTITAKGVNNIMTTCEVLVKNDIIKPSSLTLTADKQSIDVGEEITITSSIEPSNVTDKSITYASSDKSVVTINSSGKLKGIKEGSATITATTSNGISKSITIVVNATNIKATNLTTSKTLTVLAGKSVAITTSITPANTTNKNITWKSSDENIATVNSNGVVTGIKSGTTTITAVLDDFESTTIVTVKNIDIKELSLNIPEAKLLIGDTLSLRTSITPANTTNKNITWKSSNTSVATVSESGKVTALKEGTVTITATSNDNNNVSATTEITVSKIDVESFKISNKQILVTKGETKTLTVSNILPTNATYQNITYEIEDTNIATVNKKGVITGINPGQTTITVTIDEVSQTLDVTVFETGDKVYFINTFSDTAIPSDAIVLESNGKYAMIDTGSTLSSTTVINFLNDLGVKKLEFVLITHFHSESFGGIYGEVETDNLLLSNIKIGKLYMKNYSGSDSYFKNSDGSVITSTSEISDFRQTRLSMYSKIKANAAINNISYIPIDSSLKSINFGNFNLSLYNTTDQLKSYTSECLKNANCSENSNSVVVYATVNGKSFYLSGDITNAYRDTSTKYLKTKTEVSVAKKISEISEKKVDVYKASNYGSSESNATDALKNINPTYTIITNSANSFNANNSDGLDRIKKYTKQDIYYVGDGSVIININSSEEMDFTQLND